MNKFNFDSKRQLREEDAAPNFVPGGANPVCGVTAPFQTLYNTVGIGNPIPGGSDRFDRVVGKIQKKKGPKK